MVEVKHKLLEWLRERTDDPTSLRGEFARWLLAGPPSGDAQSGDAQPGAASDASEVNGGSSAGSGFELGEIEPPVGASQQEPGLLVLMTSIIPMEEALASVCEDENAAGEPEVEQEMLPSASLTKSPSTPPVRSPGVPKSTHHGGCFA